MEKKKYLDAILCGLVVSFICLMGTIYVKYTIDKNIEIVPGFGFLALIPYIILTIFFILKGLVPGCMAFLEANLLFCISRLFFVVDTVPNLTILQWIRITVLDHFMVCVFIAGVLGYLIKIIIKKTKISVLLGVISFLILNAISIFGINLPIPAPPPNCDLVGVVVK